jgi:iron complex transport system ATP-binding protein
MGELDTAIRLDHISFNYGPLKVLEDVTLNIPAGVFSILLGRNGSGKSTLIRILAGVIRAPKGRVEYFGDDGTRMSARRRAGIVGYLPQQHRAVFPFSVEEVVLTGRACHVNLMPRPVDREEAAIALERVGISHLRKRPYTELSGGEQQQVMIARVLAQDPRIVLLDEPTSHLDFINQARLLALLRGLVASDLTVVAVLHDPNLAFLYGEHFIFLKEGHVRPLPAGQAPWDVDFLESLYDVRLTGIPFGERAFIVPLIR